MKSSKNIYQIATTILAFGLLALSLACGSSSDVAVVLRVTLSACCIGGALGVIWLGWGCIKLADGIDSVARQVGTDKASHIKRGDIEAINKLVETINERFSGNTSYIAQLERQSKDAEIKIQLLRRQKRNTEAIIYSIRDAVIVVDEFDNLLMANEVAGELFGFDFKASQHNPIGELIGPEETEFINFLHQSGRSKVQATRREMEFNNERTFDCIVSCVFDDNEQVSGVVAVLHDITREKEISQMKNDFVSHVSHELKTPLASITAYAEMLVDGEVEDKKTRNECYSVIQSQAQRLNRLIEDILNISRIESGLIKVEKQAVSLAMLIEEQCQMIKSRADEKKIRIIGQESKDLIVFGQVYVDQDMISQVIINLLSNAVKYTPDKGVIKVETEVDDAAGIARVSITDTGVGIPKDEVEHVFDKFYRVDANKKQAKGTGLGLNLVKQIVETVHEGRVFVTSKVGKGSTFGFELPLATAEVVEARE